MGLLVVFLEERGSGSGAALVLPVIRGMEAGVVVATAASILMVDGVLMLAETFLRERFQKGKTVGIKQANERWAQWNHRRVEAERAGKTFTELPPSEQDDQKRQVSA